MLAKPVPSNRPPTGILILLALLLCLFLIPKFDTMMQQTVAENPKPPSRVLDAETERRLVKTESDVDEALYLVRKLHYIYGIELPTCEAAATTEEYQRCAQYRRDQVQQKQALKRYSDLERAGSTEALRQPSR